MTRVQVNFKSNAITFSLQCQQHVSGLSRDPHAQTISGRISFSFNRNEILEEMPDVHEEVLHADGLRSSPRSTPPAQASRVPQLQPQLRFTLAVLQGRQMQEKLTAR
jgi:hypothetical protein